tara:strand:+ start:864 stop:1289 length:426 start_codon:yes stop_codon:yes gene_type:complete
MDNAVESKEGRAGATGDRRSSGRRVASANWWAVPVAQPPLSIPVTIANNREISPARDTLGNIRVIRSARDTLGNNIFPPPSLNVDKRLSAWAGGRAILISRYILVLSPPAAFHTPSEREDTLSAVFFYYSRVSRHYVICQV